MTLQSDGTVTAVGSSRLRRGLVLLGLLGGILVTGVLLGGAAHADSDPGHGLLSASEDQSAGGAHHARTGIAPDVARTATSTTQRVTHSVRTTLRTTQPTQRTASHDATRATPAPHREAQPAEHHADQPAAARATPSHQVAHPGRATSARAATRAVTSTVRTASALATDKLGTTLDRTTRTVASVTDTAAPALSPVVRRAVAGADQVVRGLGDTATRATRTVDVVATDSSNTMDRATAAAPRADAITSEPAGAPHEGERTAGQRSAPRTPSRTVVQGGVSTHAGPVVTPVSSSVGSATPAPSTITSGNSAPLPGPSGAPEREGLGVMPSGGSSGGSGSAGSPAAMLPTGLSSPDVSMVPAPRGTDHDLASGPADLPGSSPD